MKRKRVRRRGLELLDDLGVQLVKRAKRTKTRILFLKKLAYIRKVSGLEVLGNAQFILEGDLGAGVNHFLLDGTVVRAPSDEDQLAEVSGWLLVSLVGVIEDCKAGLVAGQQLQEFGPGGSEVSGFLEGDLKEIREKIGKQGYFRVVIADLVERVTQLLVHFHVVESDEGFFGRQDVGVDHWDGIWGSGILFEMIIILLRRQAFKR